ncbi:MAG: metal-dependent hydrolase, partial [Deltaproteobacteria bacterium]|nr:metal-dependent hydrolase [Deltaproteobacteria bacterium]
GHRGITHSAVGITLFAPLVAALLHAVGPEANYAFYLGLVALGMGLHVLFDLITSWGTMILAPFSKRKFYWSWISFRNYPFVFTLWGTLALSFFLDPLESQIVCAAAMGFAMVMIAVAGVTQAVAKRRFRDALSAKGIRAHKLEGFPRGRRLFTWSIFAESADAFHHGTVAVTSKAPIVFNEMPKPEANDFIEAARQVPAIGFYFDVTSFVQGHYAREGERHIVTFSNARFAFGGTPVRGMAPGDGASVVFDEARRVIDAVIYGIPVPVVRSGTGTS